MKKRPGLTRLGALRYLNPKAWRAEVEGAVSGAGGDVKRAAIALGIAPRSVYLALKQIRESLP